MVRPPRRVHLPRCRRLLRREPTSKPPQGRHCRRNYRPDLTSCSSSQRKKVTKRRGRLILATLRRHVSRPPVYLFGPPTLPRRRVGLFSNVYGELVLRRGKWMTDAPSRCPNGHPSAPARSSSATSPASDTAAADTPAGTAAPATPRCTGRR